MARAIQHQTFLVTPDGRWLPEGGTDFLEEVGDLDPDYDAPMFAVKNLGFARVELISDLVISITVHPRNVDLNSLIAIEHSLANSSARAFYIRFLTTRWETELLSTAQQAFERLHNLYLLARVQERAPSERFAATRRNYEQLFMDSGHELRPVLQKWRMAFGSFDETVLPFMSRHGLLRRTVVVGVDPRETEPVFRYIGDAFNWLGDDDFPLRALGDKVTHQPDGDYGQWVAEDYRRTALRKLPQVDTISAALRGRSGRTVYDRLLLPWTTSYGEILVTVSSLVTEGATAAEPTLLMPPAKKVAKSS